MEKMSPSFEGPVLNYLKGKMNIKNERFIRIKK